MEWKGITEKTVYMGAFDFSVIVLFGNQRTSLAYVSWKFEDKETDLESNYRGKCFFKQGYIPIIWIPKKPRTNREYAIYAHECLHAIWHMFEWANIPITRDTEEVMAHSMAHLIANGLK